MRKERAELAAQLAQCQEALAARERQISAQQVRMSGLKLQCAACHGCASWSAPACPARLLPPSRPFEPCGLGAHPACKSPKLQWLQVLQARDESDRWAACALQQPPAAACQCQELGVAREREVQRLQAAASADSAQILSLHQQLAKARAEVRAHSAPCPAVTVMMYTLVQCTCEGLITKGWKCLILHF